MFTHHIAGNPSRPTDMESPHRETANSPAAASLSIDNACVVKSVAHGIAHRLKEVAKRFFPRLLLPPGQSPCQKRRQWGAQLRLEQLESMESPTAFGAGAAGAAAAMPILNPAHASQDWNHQGAFNISSPPASSEISSPPKEGGNGPMNLDVAVSPAATRSAATDSGNPSDPAPLSGNLAGASFGGGFNVFSTGGSSSGSGGHGGHVGSGGGSADGLGGGGGGGSSSPSHGGGTESSPSTGIHVNNDAQTLAYLPLGNAFGGTHASSSGITHGAAFQTHAGGTNSATFTVQATGSTAQTKFFVVDQSAHATFRYDAGGALRDQSSLAQPTNSNPAGIAVNAAGDKVWVIDANKKVYVYNAVGTLLGSWSAGSLKQPQDITTDGTDIWIVDASKDKVYRYANAATRLSGSQNPAQSFALNSENKKPAGIVVSGSILWVTDDRGAEGDDDHHDHRATVFVYSTSGRTLGKWSLDPRNSDPSGITLNPNGGNDLWVVDRHDAKVYRYADSLSWRSGSHSATDSFALASADHHPEGIAGTGGELVINHDPHIVTSPVTTTVLAGQSFNYTVQALDPDGDTLTYSLVSPPAGMTIDSDTGALAWTTALGDLGSHSITIHVADGQNGSDEQSFVVTVTDAAAAALAGTVYNDVDRNGMRLTPTPVDVTYYDPAAQFSATDNTAGASWTYGYTTTLAGTFNLDVKLPSISGVDFWGRSGGDGTPVIGHNSTDSPVQLGTVSFQPGEVFLHPGANGEQAVLRYTVPVTGTYVISSAFEPRDASPGGTDVHVLRNSISLFDGDAASSGGATFTPDPLVLNAGDTIDFVVGRGNDGTYYYDATGLRAFIAAVANQPGLTFFDPSAQFSSSSNPNGVWTYGDESSLGQTLTVYANQQQPSPGLFLWSLAGSPPSLLYNTTASTVVLGTPYVGPGQMTLHPGPNGEYSVLRFTAPFSGSYAVMGNFAPADTSHGTTDPHVLVDGTSQFDALVSLRQTASYLSAPLSLVAGQTVDFALGSGGNGYFSDLTTIDAMIVGLPPLSDPTLPNWTVYLDGNNNSHLDPGETYTVTGSDGSYSFGNLAAGNYVVREVLQPGWLPTNPASGAYVVTLTAGESATGRDLGNRLLDAGEQPAQG